MPFDPSSDDAWSNPGPLRITVHARSPDYPFPGAPLVPGGAYDDWSSWLAPPGDGSSSADWPGFGDAPSFLNGPVSWPLLPATIPNPANIGFAFSSAPTDPSNNYQNLATAPFGAPSAQPTPSNADLQSAVVAAAQRGLFGNLADIALPPAPAFQSPPVAGTAGPPPRSDADLQLATAQAAQRGLLGRLAEIVTPQSSAAEVQAAMRVIAQRTLLGKLADTAAPASEATSIPTLGRNPNDWMVPIEDGHLDDWIPAEKKLAPDGYPNDWIVPPTSAVPTIQTNIYSKGWITPSATPLQNGGFAGAGYPPLNSLISSSPRPASQIDYWQSVQSNLQAPLLSPYLAPVSGTVQSRPWWVPAPPASRWEPWADEFIKGMQGLINYFRSHGGSGRPGGGGEEDCYDRWEREDARCPQFRPWGTRAVAACRDRASARRDKCIRNGGRPDPTEPREFDFGDMP